MVGRSCCDCLIRPYSSVSTPDRQSLNWATYLYSIYLQTAWPIRYQLSISLELSLDVVHSACLSRTSSVSISTSVVGCIVAFIRFCRACCARLILWISLFYVLPLNGFTAEEVEGSVSDVTAEKKTALTYRKTPFWRIKSVKWLWKCRQRGWMCLPAEELSGKRLRFSRQFLKVFLFVFAFLVKLWTVAHSVVFKVDFLS